MENSSGMSKRGWFICVILISITLLMCYLLGLPSGFTKKNFGSALSVDTPSGNKDSMAVFEKLLQFYPNTSGLTTIKENRSSPKISQLNVTEQIRADQMLRDSIDAIHSKNFIKPVNESCKGRLPSCIVIGVRKCGTRELIDFMHLHPHIQRYRAITYEMKYFLEPRMKGLEWLKQQMPCSYSNQITVMKNARYFHSGLVAERIKQFNDSIKLILIVREPISRLVADLTFHKLIEPVQLPNLEYNNLLRFNTDAIKLSVYNESMALWLKYFSLSQILVIESNELKYDPVSVLRRVEEFLGLDHFITPDLFVFNSDKGFFCITSNLTSTGMACYYANRGRNAESLPQATVNKLNEYFKPRNKKFFDLIGRSFNW